MTMYNSTPLRDYKQINNHLTKLRELFRSGKTYRYYVSATRGVVIFFNDQWIPYEDAASIYPDLEVA